MDDASSLHLFFVEASEMKDTLGYGGFGEG
jgi:hypothetical protein